MASPTAVNDQITDAVTQANVNVLADAPAQAMGALYQSVSQSLGIAMQNAVAQQQQANVGFQAATVMGVETLLGASSRKP